MNWKATASKGLKSGLISVGLITVAAQLFQTFSPFTFSISSSPSIATGVYYNYKTDFYSIQAGDMVIAQTYGPYFTHNVPLNYLQTVKRIAGVPGDQVRWDGDRLIVCPGPRLTETKPVSIRDISSAAPTAARVHPAEVACDATGEGSCSGPSRTIPEGSTAEGKGEGCQVVAVRLPDDLQGNVFPKPEFPAVIPKGQLLLIAEHPASFDARYYGLMPLSVIEAKAEPFWVEWPDIEKAWDLVGKLYGDRVGGRPDRWEVKASFPPPAVVSTGEASGKPEAREPAPAGESAAPAARPDSAFGDSGDSRDSAFPDSSKARRAAVGRSIHMISGVIHIPSGARVSASDS